MTTYSVMGLDARYTVMRGPNICFDRQSWVAFFDDSSIGHYHTKQQAEDAAREFHKQRMGE